ncbi:MAG: hydrogenase, partial [Deltaproteobacteria bacterium]|nr:hydrogenase [Deltaproteobacteria bacterium]
MKNGDRKRSLLFTGALLVLVGLLSGVAIPVTTTARLGLSAHL